MDSFVLADPETERGVLKGQASGTNVARSTPPSQGLGYFAMNLSPVKGHQINHRRVLHNAANEMLCNIDVPPYCCKHP
jgi:hypothetical protein